MLLVLLSDISWCGLRFDDEAKRIVALLRLDSTLCAQYIRTSGALNVCRGTHALSGKRNIERYAKHASPSDIFHHVLYVRAGVALIKVLVGMSCADIKSPDEFTLAPLQGGRNAVWDVTVAILAIKVYYSGQRCQI